VTLTLHRVLSCAAILKSGAMDKTRASAVRRTNIKRKFMWF